MDFSCPFLNCCSSVWGERYSYCLFPTSVGQVLYRQAEVCTRGKVVQWRKWGSPIYWANGDLGSLFYGDPENFMTSDKGLFLKTKDACNKTLRLALEYVFKKCRSGISFVALKFWFKVCKTSRVQVNLSVHTVKNSECLSFHVPCFAPVV